ncbi:hypothetical protein [Companilactobacillus sp. FL22-1]|uniref:lectin-like domain-containing protein n=1 Tax=Companilactobacillus sp. FL22-1 TaxID=3373892 RepID=UPI00375479FF
MNKINWQRLLPRLPLIFVGAILLIFLLLQTNCLIVKADNADYDHALATAPKGLAWDPDNFVIAKFPSKPSSSKGSDINNASIVKSTNPNNLDTSIISLTNGTYQTGAVWSNFSKDNYFDLSHPQVASMWLYFGNTGDHPADGMAFVLQHDSENAIALSADGTPVNGQSLGVWGADWDYNQGDSKVIAKTAIQNSWALEFDTFVNDLTQYDKLSGEGVSFDAYFNRGQHIATGYPGDYQNYTARIAQGPNGQVRYYYTMSHTGYIGDDLTIVDSHWHHVTVKWTPPTDPSSSIGKIAYYFNDKDPNGSANIPNNERHLAVDVDIKKFNFQKPDEPKRLYWGFTGSTGKFFENNLVIFESLPSFVDAEASATIHNDTQNKDIISTSTADVNDEITYTYNLNYKGWTKEWTKINAKMDIPQNVSLTSGSVYYPTTGKTYQIPASAFTDPKLVKYLLPESLNNKSRTAVIKLHGNTAKTAPTLLTVPKAQGIFEGDNLITNTTAPGFQIRSRLLKLDSNFPNHKKINPGEDVDVDGQLYYTNNNTIVNSNITVHPTLNGKSLPAFKLDDKDPAGSFKIHLDHSQFKNPSINTLSFFAIDTSRNISNPLNKVIEIGSSVSLDVSKNVAFNDIKFSKGNQIISRKPGWIVKVTDNRNSGNSWRLEAKGSPLINITNKTQTLNGNMLFKDSFDQIFPLDKNVQISQNTKTSDEEQITDVTQTWTSDNGILLSLLKPSLAGTYQGVIDWTLVDSIQKKS